MLSSLWECGDPPRKQADSSHAVKIRFQARVRSQKPQTPNERKRNSTSSLMHKSHDQGFLFFFCACAGLTASVTLKFANSKKMRSHVSYNTGCLAEHWKDFLRISRSHDVRRLTWHSSIGFHSISTGWKLPPQ